MSTPTTHETVLLTEAVAGLAICPSDVVVDATIGGAGHFKALLEELDSQGTLIGIDADSEAIMRAKEASQGASARVILAEDNFRNLGALLDANGIATIDKALFDLGWSAFHLTAGKGFSFQVDEPLLMTYGTPREGSTAADMLNSAPEETLADIFFTLGEERFARSIARAVVERRHRARILTTRDLVEAVMEGTPSWYHHRRIHPATKTFQALRIAVNDELNALREGIQSALTRLNAGGRVAVISFHSIEDRIVKLLLRDAAHQGFGTLVTKKPIVPSYAECVRNPRARSAKLRIFEKAEVAVASKEHDTSYIYA